MLIQYTGGARQRIVGSHVWSQANGFVADILDAELAATLLTARGFVVAHDEPLAGLPGVGAQRVAELTLVGIASMGDLRALDDAGIARVAGLIWASEKQIRNWVELARGTATPERVRARRAKHTKEDER